MRKRAVFVAAALAALVLAPAAPASAATTKRRVLPCGNGSTKSARVTYRITGRKGLIRLAAKNPCDRWLSIGWNVGDRSPSKSDSVEVAPGARFYWRHQSFAADRLSAGLLGTEQTCHDGDGMHYVVGAEDACE